MKPLFLLPAFGLAALLSLSGCKCERRSDAAAAPAKPKIAKLDDLPRHTYDLPGKATDAVTDPAVFGPLAAKLEADTEGDLANFDISDKTTLKRLKGVLLALAALRGDDAKALQLIGEIRTLEDKPAAKYLTGLVGESRIAAKRQAGTSEGEAYAKAFRADFDARLAALPWNIVQSEVKDLKGTFEIRSKNLLLGVIASEIEPAVAKTHVLSYDTAERLVNARSFIELTLPLKPEAVGALTAIVDAHKSAKPDIWAAREATFGPGYSVTPVAVGVWDSGVDLPLFSGCLALDAHRHPLGIAFDLLSNPVPELLFPIPHPERIHEMKGQLKGLLDLHSAIDSPEAAAIKQKMAAIKPEEVQPYLEQVEMFANFAHGTHVAGIFTKGNPAARIVVGRITFDYHLIPMLPTPEQSRKDAAAYRATVDFFKAQHVRVVNMSWGGSLRDTEEALEKNGWGKDAAERKARAREIFDIDRDGLKAALESAPEILFVTAAGNSDNDVAFDEVTPSSFRMPNLITVGAVDQAGDETSFTSFGDNVTVYADGFEVKSLIPGGDILPLSGTSMASPGVANLAAKLFAVDPALTVAEVVDLIRKGATAGSDSRITLVDPKASLELLKARHQK